MKTAPAAVLLVACALAGQAQMTRDQRRIDFQTLAAQFAKRYGPYEWKRDLLNVDLLHIGPWLDRAANARDDLDFYETCIDYVAQLQDGHVGFYLPSDFVASLGFTVDLYDGRPLIESVSRTRLPAKTYSFEIGDELVSIDGLPVSDLLDAFSKYQMVASPHGTRRLAAQLLTVRPQEIMPHAPEVGEKAVVVVRRQNGDTETYEIPWTKTGVPLNSVGPVLTPQSAARGRRSASLPHPRLDGPADYLAPLRPLLHAALPRPRALAGFGALRPLFAVPPNFQTRLGSNSFSDAFFSGTYEAGGRKLGYIRIPSFAPDIDTASAINQFQREILYFQANTDGLIVDVMRNAGGYPDYAVELARRLIPRTFRATTYELRATAEWVWTFSQLYQQARAGGAPQYVLDGIQSLLGDVREAYAENRGRTGPLALSGLYMDPPTWTADIPPVTDRAGNVVAYSKPVMVLIDEMSFSAADMFPAMLQDNGAAILFGTRTAGLGGMVAEYDAGAYSEALVGITLGLAVRKGPIVTPDYPTTAYIENVGVRPDIEEDYMTRDNLVNRGRTFVEDFTGALVAHILSRE